jgi:hypothetical protein
MVGELRGTMERERAPMGIFLTLERPTREMLAEAAGYYFSRTSSRHSPAIQILTVQDLLEGCKPEFPLLVHDPHVTAGRRPDVLGEQTQMFGRGVG